MLVKYMYMGWIPIPYGTEIEGEQRGKFRMEHN